jgi:hypothetical protein
VSRFRFVSDHRHAYPVKRLCQLCEVSRSGFYAWLKRPPSARELADRALLLEIEQIHRDSRCTYGAPRVHGQLARREMPVETRQRATATRSNAASTWYAHATAAKPTSEAGHFDPKFFFAKRYGGADPSFTFLDATPRPPGAMALVRLYGARKGDRNSAASSSRRRKPHCWTWPDLPPSSPRTHAAEMARRTSASPCDRTLDQRTQGSTARGDPHHQPTTPPIPRQP